MGQQAASASLAPPLVKRLFADTLADHGDRVALVEDGTAVTYGELDERVAAIVDQLGSTRRLVAVEAATTIASVAAYLAALRGRHPVLLLPPEHQAGRQVLDTYDPDVTMSADGGWRPLERRRGSRHALHADLALLLSTSGSTGSAKLVRLSGDAVQANADAIATYLGLTEADRAITTLPLHYCYGLSVLNSHLAVGAGVILNDLSVVDARFWDRFRSGGATSLAGVPYTFELLDRVGFEAMRLPTLRYLTQAGGRMASERVRHYAELGARRGWELFVMYGQTEATARMAYLPPALAATNPSSIGVAIPGGSLTLDPLDDGHPAGGGTELGELIYRGPNVMLGYARGPDDLAAGRVVAELRTGDLARRTPDGLFEVVGRRSRFIKPFGVRVDLDHLERLLADAGYDSACGGDDTAIAAAVVGTADDAANAARQVATITGVPLGKVNTPAVKELPRLANGKPDYATVVVLATRATSQLHQSAQSTSPVDAVRAAYEESLGRPVDVSESFVSAGGDSLSYIELSMRLEEVLGHLPTDWHIRPVADLMHVKAEPVAHVDRVRRLETTVALRAAAIVLVVGAHAQLWNILGGAHLLLGIAGYNFARFQLAGATACRCARRVAVPAMCWLAAVAMFSGEFGWPHALLVNSVIGAPDSRWAYWFIEALVQLLLVVGGLLAIPAVRQAERRSPLAFALAVTAVGLAIRFNLFDIGPGGHRLSRAHELLWLFALGWAAALVATVRTRLLVSALIVAAVAGFFGNAQREAVVIVGMLGMLWRATLPVPAALHRVAAVVASASLWIYLTHWQLYPVLARTAGPVVAFLGSIGAGVVAWRSYDVVVSVFRKRIFGRQQARYALLPAD